MVDNSTKEGENRLFYQQKKRKKWAINTANYNFKTYPSFNLVPWIMVK